MDTYQIRPITPADDPKIARIIRDNLERFHLDIPGTAYFDKELDRLSEYYMTEGRSYFVVVREDNMVLGGVGITEFDGLEDCAQLQKLYLSDDAKGYGLGKKLMATAEEFVQGAGYQRLYLETHSNLEAAIGLYEKLGFRQIPKPEGVLHSTMNRFYLKEYPVD